MNRRRFAILDRDGTIIFDRHYLSDPAQVELLPGAVEGMRQLAQMGLGLIAVTNQSGVGRGYFDEVRLAEIHHRLEELLAAEGIYLDDIYYCPHLPQDNCPCRKPLPGLITKAAQDWQFHPPDSFVIGDKPCDIDLGKNVGATTILVKTGYGSEVALSGEVTPDYIVEDLLSAAQAIQQQLAADIGVKNAIRS